EVAERVVLGHESGCEQDREQARNRIAQVVGLLGVSAAECECSLRRAVERYLTANRAAVETLAAALLAQGTIRGERLRAAFGDLPPLDLSEVTKGIARAAGVA